MNLDKFVEEFLRDKRGIQAGFVLSGFLVVIPATMVIWGTAAGYLAGGIIFLIIGLWFPWKK